MSYDLKFLLARAQELSEDPSSIDDVAGAALALAACRTAIDAALEPLKEILRDDARKDLAEDELGEEVVIEYDGNMTNALQGEREATQYAAGLATVTFQPRRCRVNKGTKAWTMKALLGPQFGEYFELITQVQPRRDFQDQCTSRQKDHPVEVSAVMSMVELFEPKPRVGFRPFNSVEP